MENFMEEKEEKIKSNKIVITNQNQIYLTGITKVLTSTESEISVAINGQNLSISGEKLSVTKLDIESGILEATGLVTAMRFSGTKQKQNIFKRVFG